VIDQRPQIRCSRCGAAAAVAPDRDEPAGGSECWCCALSARDIATMKAEAFDYTAQSRIDDECIRDDSTECDCSRCIGAEVGTLRAALAKHQCAHGVDEHDECERCMDEAERDSIRAAEAGRG